LTDRAADAASGAPGWELERVAAPAGEIHARALPDPPRRTVWVHDVTGPALVLGSRQPDEVVDRRAADAAGVAVVRRRSGGGAVYVDAASVVWVDLVIPPGDPLADDDVARATHWVGDAWAAALADGPDAPGRYRVHRGPLERSEWSEQVCFAALGPGEVTLDGRKVVGIAQRRTRSGTWFQTAALLRWDPADVVDLLAIDPAVRADARRDLAPVAAPAPVGRDALVAALLRRLPA